MLNSIPKLGIWPRLDRNMASLNVAHSHSILPSIIPKCVSVFSVRMEESILSLIFHGCETIVLLRAMKLGLSKRNNSKEQSQSLFRLVNLAFKSVDTAMA